MYYETRKNDHGLPHDPFLALVVPRPIGWISTIGASGVVNLAPYSYFNAVATKPYYVIFSSNGRKDSRRNAEDTGQFVANLAVFDLRHEMNLSSAMVDSDVSEPEMIGLEMAPSRIVRPPRVARSPVAFECVYTKTVELPGADGNPHSAAIVVGEVVAIHIADELLVDGKVDIARVRPISRLGYSEYATVESTFEMLRPQAKKKAG